MHSKIYLQGWNIDSAMVKQVVFFTDTAER